MPGCSGAVLRGHLPRQDASLLMGGFRWLRRQRFEGLVRGYLAHVCMKEAEETLEQLQGSCGCVKAHSVLGRLRGLRQQVGLARTALQPCFLRSLAGAQRRFALSGWISGSVARGR